MEVLLGLEGGMQGGERRAGTVPAQIFRRPHPDGRGAVAKPFQDLLLRAGVEVVLVDEGAEGTGPFIRVAGVEHAVCDCSELDAVVVAGEERVEKGPEFAILEGFCEAVGIWFGAEEGVKGGSGYARVFVFGCGVEKLGVIAGNAGLDEPKRDTADGLLLIVEGGPDRGLGLG